MMLTGIELLPFELLLQTIIDIHFSSSNCITLVSDEDVNIKLTTSFISISANEETENLENNLLTVSEIGCSDYIIYMSYPQVFMKAFDKVSQLGNVRRSDRKLVFLSKYNDSSFCDILQMKETSFIANLLLLIPVSNNKPNCQQYDLVTHKYVGNDDEILEQYFLDRWYSCTNKFENNVNLFPHDMSNLRGKTLKVATFTYKPYVLLDLDKKISPLGRDGLEVRIIEEFCRWVNCTIELVRDDESEWGELYENKTGIGILGNVVEDKADMGIGALYSWYQVYRMLDFSAPIIRSGITCIAPAARMLSSWELPLLAFSWYTWLALFFTLIYATVGLTIAQRFSTDKVLLTAFGLMITQAQPEKRVVWQIRRVTFWLLIAGLVIDNSYGAGLASTFTIPKYEQPIDTMKDVVDRKIEWGATHDAWIFSLTLSTEPLIKQLVSQFRIYTSEELERKSFTRSMAFSIEKLPAGYFAIGEYITEDAVPDFEIMLEDFYYEQCVVILRKSSQYTEKISELIGRLHQSGLLLAWETQVALKHLNYKVQLEVKLSRGRRDVDMIEPLNYRKFVGIFSIYGIGVVLSTGLFIGEIMSFRRNKKVVHVPIVINE